MTGEFLAQRASNAENVSIWWRPHGNAFIRYPRTYLDGSLLDFYHGDKCNATKNGVGFVSHKLEVIPHCLKVRPAATRQCPLMWIMYFSLSFSYVTTEEISCRHRLLIISLKQNLWSLRCTMFHLLLIQRILAFVTTHTDRILSDFETIVLEKVPRLRLWKERWIQGYIEQLCTFGSVLLWFSYWSILSISFKFYPCPSLLLNNSYLAYVDEFTNDGWYIQDWATAMTIMSCFKGHTHIFMVVDADVTCVKQATRQAIQCHDLLQKIQCRLYMN